MILDNVYDVIFYSEFLAPGAREPVNVDSRVMECVRKKLENSPNRFCFDEAEVSVTIFPKSVKVMLVLRY